MPNAAADTSAQVRFFESRGEGIPAQPSLYLKIDGIEKPFAVMQYSSTFAKNEIPTATCVLGTGHSLSKNNKVSVPEQLAENIDGAVLTKAKVFLKFGPKSKWEPGPLSSDWPREYECVFEGYYAGLSYARVGPQIQMSINLVHRLVDLTFGSLMTGWQHPSNPSNFLTPAIAPMMGGTDGDCHEANAGAEGTWSSSSFLQDSVEQFGESDFGHAILQTLLCMSAQDVFRLNCGEPPPPRQPNEAAAEVFHNMTSKTGGLRSPMNTSDFLFSIGIYMGKIIDDSGGLTYWDYLVGKICPDFYMAVIPLPSVKSSPDNAYAYLTADTPGLNKEYKTLYLGDYTNFSFKARMWKPLYAVGVMSVGDNLSGAEMPNNKQKPTAGGLCLGGVFPLPGDPALDKQLGQYLLIYQPNWLQYINFSTGAVRDFGDTGQAAHDAINGDSEKSLPAPDKEPADLNEDRTKILDMYAKMYYVHNAINGRGGTFDSKFRFDISPGTILKLDKGLDPAKAAQESRYKELPSTVYVQVSRVTHNVSAEAPMAKTSFDCVHLRTEKENDMGQPEGRYSIDEHVFLKGPDDKNFLGAPLIEKWKF